MEKSWTCPGELAATLRKANRIIMVLAIPAIFDRNCDSDLREGCLPNWLDENLEGSPPGCEIRLRLRSVKTSRWQAVSGW